jgi:hypothetical protein
MRQPAPRSEARILVCFLALAMGRTLQQRMNGYGLGDAPEEFSNKWPRFLPSISCCLPPLAPKSGCAPSANPTETHVAILLQRLGLLLPNKPKAI